MYKALFVLFLSVSSLYAPISSDAVFGFVSVAKQEVVRVGCTEMLLEDLACAQAQKSNVALSALAALNISQINRPNSSPVKMMNISPRHEIRFVFPMRNAASDSATTNS